MAKLTDIVIMRTFGKGRYEAEIPGFGRFEAERPALATEAAVTAFQEFHLMGDDMKVAYIPCNDGKTLFHCWATPRGWTYNIVKLTDGRSSSSGSLSRTGDTRTWEQFIDRMRAWAADYDGTASAAAS
ncbi:hypothetical protein E1286_46100 [Nonomuraea terrae]|uniref:Uncharacterized protein n=1 Tax=Nonomuraea terrae TaxID=2530383 RepID=A0A4R4XHP7_9ACTN|nr:hypothetical protein [Nonomuraea terrae]TDD30189.1 hypothetical protein E1286_46100 [Nonomuraea terrae]